MYACSTSVYTYYVQVCVKCLFHFLSPPDDEPVDGPSCYILLTGFTSVNLCKELPSLKLNITAVVKIKYNEVDRKKTLDIGTVADVVTGKDKMLHNVIGTSLLMYSRSQKKVPVTQALHAR